MRRQSVPLTRNPLSLVEPSWPHRPLKTVLIIAVGAFDSRDGTFTAWA